jgi:hypothetical protein
MLPPLTAAAAHDPTLRCGRALCGKNFESKPALGALNRSSALRQESVVELVLGATAVAANVHGCAARAYTIRDAPVGSSTPAGPKPTGGPKSPEKLTP